MTRREQLIEELAEARRSMQQHVCRLQELLESKEWDLAIDVLRKSRDLVWLMSITTNDLADLEDA